MSLDNSTADFFHVLHYWRALPIKERSCVKNIHDNFNSIAGLPQRFEDAIALFEFATQKASEAYNEFHRLERQGVDYDFMTANRLFGNWSLMAARDGALALSLCSKLLKQMKIDSELSATTLDKLGSAFFDVFVQRFDQTFPKINNVRDAASHGSEFFMNDTGRKKHATKEPFFSHGIHAEGRGIMISDSLNGNVYFATYKGEIVSYEISSATLAKLKSFIQDLARGFKPLTDYLDLEAQRLRDIGELD